MSVQRIHLDFPAGGGTPAAASYDIRVGRRIHLNLGGHLRAVPAVAKADRLFILSDDNVAPLYLDTVRSSLESAGFVCASYTVEAGEDSKTPACAEAVWTAMAEAGCTRVSALVALGGGVICDLGAFCAATYMRGIPCVQVPNSLLAMVDASVGGKTALDIAGIRNLVGTFTQPAYVAIDVAALETLPAREWESGTGELVKTALLLDDDACIFLADRVDALLARDLDFVQELIVQAIAFKAEVVTEDEHDHGGRVRLNYGHTYGHALEAVLGPGVLSHGAAVAEGMRFAGLLAQRVLGDADVDAFIAAQNDLLDVCCLPCLGNLSQLPAEGLTDALIAAMRHDKKGATADGDCVPFVLLSAPGVWRVESIAPDLLRTCLMDYLR